MVKMTSKCFLLVTVISCFSSRTWKPTIIWFSTGLSTFDGPCGYLFLPLGSNLECGGGPGAHNCGPGGSRSYDFWDRLLCNHTLENMKAFSVGHIIYCPKRQNSMISGTPFCADTPARLRRHSQSDTVFTVPNAKSTLTEKCTISDFSVSLTWHHLGGPPPLLSGGGVGQCLQGVPEHFFLCIYIYNLFELFGDFSPEHRETVETIAYQLHIMTQQALFCPPLCSFSSTASMSIEDEIVRHNSDVDMIMSIPSDSDYFAVFPF